MAPGLDAALSGRLRPRLIAIDLDGTLLRSDHTLAAATVEAIAAARAAGIVIVLASSRPPAGMHATLAALDLLAPAVFVGCQGAVVGRFHGDRLEVVEARLLPRPAAERAARLAAEQDLPISWVTPDHWYTQELTPEIEREARVLGVSPSVRADLAVLADPAKLLAIAPDAASARELVAAMPAEVCAVTSDPRYVDVTAPGVDKAWGVSTIAEARGFAMSEIAAIGDGLNDVSMLRAAGLGIAPAHAGPEVRSAADALTAHHDADGAAHAIEAMLALPSD